MRIGFGNGASFKKEMDDFAKLPWGGVKAIREEAQRLFRDIVDKTPKDSNFASSKWKGSINSRPPTRPIKNPRSSSGFSPASTPTFSHFRGKDKIYIYNNVAYIGMLENGWSKQAPKNFAKNATARAERRIQRAFKRLR